MSRIYGVPYTGTITNSGGNTDLLLMLPGDDKPCRLVGWVIGQSTEIGDAMEEGVHLTIRHFAATVSNGSGGSSVTPTTSPNQAAAGFSARCNDATVATTSGTATILDELAWNIRNVPWPHWLDEQMRERCFARQGEAIIVRLDTTVADDLTIGMTFYVEEF